MPSVLTKGKTVSGLSILFFFTFCSKTLFGPMFFRFPFFLFLSVYECTSYYYCCCCYSTSIDWCSLSTECDVNLSILFVGKKMKSNKTGKQQETALEGNLDSVFLETGLSSALTSSSLLSTLEILTCSRNRATLFFLRTSHSMMSGRVIPFSKRHLLQ